MTVLFVCEVRDKEEGERGGGEEHRQADRQRQIQTSRQGEAGRNKETVLQTETLRQ